MLDCGTQWPESERDESLASSRGRPTMCAGMVWNRSTGRSVSSRMRCEKCSRMRPPMTSTTANRRSYRDRARQRIARFIEVLVDSSLEVCIQRDPKGIYRKARQGQATHVPGMQAICEPPEKPDIIIRGDHDDPEEAARRTMDLLA